MDQEALTEWLKDFARIMLNRGVDVEDAAAAFATVACSLDDVSLDEATALDEIVSAARGVH